MTTTAVEPSTLKLSLDRWRVRDALATTRASAIADLRLDSPVGTPVRRGLAPLAAGLGNGHHWRTALGTDGLDVSEPISRYRRTCVVSIDYGEAAVGIGDQLTLSSEATDSSLTTVVAGPDGEVASIRHTFAEVPITDEQLAPAAEPPDPGSESLGRVRLARWVYVAGELEVVHGNHVTSVAAGLPAAAVPESFLTMLSEEALGAADGLARSLTVQIDTPVAVGGWVRLEASGPDVVLLRSASGIIGKAWRA